MPSGFWSLQSISIDCTEVVELNFDLNVWINLRHQNAINVIYLMFSTSFERVRILTWSIFKFTQAGAYRCITTPSLSLLISLSSIYTGERRRRKTFQSFDFWAGKFFNMHILFEFNWSLSFSFSILIKHQNVCISQII